ncbi:beta-propeller fold lactonase family protein [Microbacterium phyllosphaerae]
MNSSIAPTKRARHLSSTVLRLALSAALAVGVLLTAPATTARADAQVDLIENVPMSATSFGSALSPDGSRLYVVQSGGTVTAIDTATREIVASAVFGGVVFTGVAVSADGSKLYAVDNGAFSARVLDAVSLEELVSLPTGGGSLGVTQRPGTTEIWIANYGSSDEAITVIDSATDTVVGTIAGRTGGGDIAFTPDGLRAYMSHSRPGDYDVDVIDAATRTVVAIIPRPFVSDRLEGIAVSPDGTELYGAAQGSDSLSISNTATNTPETDVPVGSTPVDIAVSSEGKRVYVANLFSDSLSVVDTATRTVSATIPLGGQPRTLQISPDDRWAYVVLRSNAVAVIALDTFPEITTATLPDGTGGLPYSASIAATGSPSPQFGVTTGALPTGLTLDPATGALSGTPSVSGTFSFTVTASSLVSGIPAAAARAYTITLAPVVAVPATPGALTAIPGASGIDLAWGSPSSDGGSPVTGYRIERSTGDTAFVVLVADTANTDTVYRDTTAVLGQPYQYRVTALNAAGAGAVSNVAAAVRPSATPGDGSTGGAGEAPADPAASAAGLAATGAEVPIGAMGAGVLLLIVGAVLTMSRRRRTA